MSALNSLLSLLQHYALTQPSSDFLVEDKGHRLTYGEAYLLATQLIPTRLKILCSTLTGFAGIRDAPRVLLLTPNTTLFALSYFALWHMSAVAVPVSISADPSLWAGIVNIIQPELILVSSNLEGTLRQSLDDATSKLSSRIPIIAELGKIIPEEFYAHREEPFTRASDFIPALHRWMNFVFKNILPQAISECPPSHLNPDAPAVTLFTSSAVDWNTLKCVTYTHDVLVHSSQRCIQMLGGTEYSAIPKRHLGWLPLSHCFEFCITFCSIVLGTGGSYIFFDRSLSSPSAPPSTPLPPLLLSGMAYHFPVTSFTCIPAFVAELLTLSIKRDDGSDIPTLHLLATLHSIGVGGAPTPAHVFAWAAARGIKYFDCSGATEAAGTVCTRRSWDETQRLSGLEVIPGLMGLLEKSNVEDDFGELIIKATHIPTGYDNRTSPAYHFNPSTGVTTYRTGDLYSHKRHIPVLSYLVGEESPKYDPNQVPLAGLDYIGRVDDMVILTSGTKLDALSLERTLDSHPSIQRSALLANKTADFLLALIQPHLPFHPNVIIETALALNNTLPFEKRLRRENIYLVSELPVTTKFTLNRKKIKKMLSEIKTDDEIPVVFPYPRESNLDMGSAIIPESERKKAIIVPKIISLLSNIFSIPESQLDPSLAFSAVPLTSLASTRLAKALQENFDIGITSAQIYSIHTVDQLAQFVATKQDKAGDTVSDTVFEPSLSPFSTPFVEEEPTMYRPTRHHLSNEDIIITGAACRFPGGITSLDDFWSALLAPSVHLSSLSHRRPTSRWPYPHSDEDLMYPMGWLDDASVTLTNTTSFAEFFGLDTQEVKSMSPNARIVLQLGYEAILSTGVRPKSLDGKNWGVYTSLNCSGWQEKRAAEASLREYATGLSGSADEAAGARLAYFLNLTGPTMEVKAACSSGVVAIHQACLAIRNGDCDAAIVIGSTTHFHPSSALFRSQNGLVSSSGKCMPFSGMADGFVASEGTVAIVLQKASDPSTRRMAYGVVKATSVTQDGRSQGFYAPNPDAQKRLLQTVLDKAGVAASDIGYLEGHGTGTRLGDEIELEVIKDVFSSRKYPLLVGSVKAVIGHTEECAGLAGVLKALLCLKHNAIPPQPPTGPLNKVVDHQSCKITVPAKITPFLAHQGQARLCAISSFGLYGTLGSIIIEEPPSDSPNGGAKQDEKRSHSLFVLSAGNSRDLHAVITSHLEFFNGLQLHSEDLESVCRTSQIGRDHFLFRRAWSVTGWRALLDNLYKVSSDLKPSIQEPIKSNPRFAIWFSLPLSRRTSLNLNSHHPLYHSKLKECQEASWNAEYAYFESQLALAKCLVELGCKIEVVGGEGSAEYLAAVFVGLIPPSAVFRLRGEVTSSPLTFVVRCTGETLNNHLTEWRSDELTVVGKHGPDVFTIRGSAEAMESLANDNNVKLDGTLPRQTILTPVVLASPPSIPILSSHIGDVLDDEAALSVDYWTHVQSRDMNSEEVWQALAQKCDFVINLGTASEIKQVLGRNCISTESGTLEDLIAGVYEAGCSIDWNKFASKGPKFHLPPYKWAEDTN